MQSLRIFACSLLALVLSLPAGAADKVTCYTMWDDSFFYAAFEVQDPDVVSANTAHMSNPWEDDCVEVFLETDNQRAPDRTPSTFQMSVSAGGGSSFVVGENGQPKPKKIFTFKCARKVQGTPNRSYDRDLGYTIELAMPWKEMGGPPAPGRVMGFNMICRLKGENTGFVSFSPQVASEEDVHVPAKWGTIKFMETPTIIARQDSTIICRKVARRAPLIDGNLGPGEWIRDMRFQMVKPEPPTVRPGPKFMIEKLALTHYFYWYQGDGRREAPFGHVRREDGSSELTDHPLEGVGPWFSHDRVQWHKDQLADIRNAGIDVVIPVYWGAAATKKQFASKGLNCMVQALKELKAEGKSYPLVAMFNDTSAMWVQYGSKPDLRNDEVKETFYGMIKDFFLQVPEEFRAAVQLPVEKGGQPAYIVVLYTASWFSDLDAGFVEYCNERFAKDFGGRKLVWIGHSDFRPKAAVMDGYSNYGAGLGLQFDDTGWIRIAGVGAGFDNSAVHGMKTPIRSRTGGDTYKKDWDALMEKSPDWVIVDGWNELHEGSDICPSSEYGNQYVSLTKIGLLRFNGMRAYDAKFLKHDTPPVMSPGVLYQVTLTIKNAGAKPWYPGLQGVFLAGRWFKDGTLFADSGARLPLQETVLAGHILQKTIGIRAADQDGKPLPEGDYELRWELVRTRDEWFSDGGDVPLCVPVKVSASPVVGFSLVNSTLPTLMKSGGTYNVTVKLRNDCAAAWKAGVLKPAYRWHKASVHLGKDSEDSMEPLPGCTGTADLTVDLEPGRVIEVTLPVRVAGQDGTPIPVWTQNDLWTYIVSWEMVRADGQVIPLRFGQEAVKVLADDYGPKFIAGDTPDEMPAGKQCKVSLTIENAGADVWTRADFSVGCHWYYLDGIEAVWEGAKSRLPSDVRPGERVIVKASATTPPCDGQYYLVWDLAHGDKWVSTLANSRGNDILIVPVNVTNGKLAAQDLTQLFDLDVTSFDMNRRDGDADGAGLTLAAELLPPQVNAIAAANKFWPCGLWTSVQGAGLESSRRISFKYPSKADGAKNAVSCKGQSIALKPGRYAAVHLLALATQDTTGEFTLAYKGSKAPSAVDFSAWNEAPKHGEHPAFVCLHRHSPDGEQRGQACWLNHYVLQTDPKAELISLSLPDNPAVKIMAITLEKAE